MIRYRFHPEALDEANAAASFYEDRAKGLGLRFINELDETIDRIRANPFIYRPLDGNTRKCRIRQFPHAVVYRVNDDEIQVIAVMHLRRSPGYWKERLKPGKDSQSSV